MEDNVFIPFDTTLYKARFIERPNRFLVRCELVGDVEAGAREDTENGIALAHLADPGRLKELLVPGREIWLKHINKEDRKTKWSVALCQTPECNGFISLDTTMPNRLIGKALQMGAIEELSRWKLVRPEYTMGNSRWDFLLSDDDDNKLVLEVKSVTLVKDKTGLFPDAITARGAKHVRELCHIAGEKGWYAGVLFVAQRDDLFCIKPATEIDPTFASEIKKAKQAEVLLLGRKCNITLEGIGLGGPLPVSIE